MLTDTYCVGLNRAGQWDFGRNCTANQMRCYPPFHEDIIRGHGLTTTTNTRKCRGRFAAATMTTVLVLLMQPAAAWNATGHKATAKLAYELLTPEQQEQASRILTAHPRYKEDFRDAMPDEIASGTIQDRLYGSFSKRRSGQTSLAALMMTIGQSFIASHGTSSICRYTLNRRMKKNLLPGSITICPRNSARHCGET